MVRTGKQLTTILVLSVLSLSAHADHAWNNYHWARTANSFTLQIVDSMTADWQSELTTALSEWSSSTVLGLAVTSANDNTRERKRCKMVTGHPT